jgi:hypothetical protein
MSPRHFIAFPHLCPLTLSASLTRWASQKMSSTPAWHSTGGCSAEGAPSHQQTPRSSPCALLSTSTPACRWEPSAWPGGRAPQRQRACYASGCVATHGTQLFAHHLPSCAGDQDTAALCAYGNATHVAAGGDTRCFYVLQLETDLLTGQLLAVPSSDVTRGPEDGPLLHSMYRVLGPGINEEAISRVWLAKRDSSGAFLTCDPPTGTHGALHEWTLLVARCSQPAGLSHTGRQGE